jgi:hypothetical protein
MIDLSQLRLLVIRPTLEALAASIPYSLAAENLILGTGLHESQYFNLAQVGGGPALGFWQMEPATFTDCWTNYINFRVPLRTAILGLCGSVYPEASALVTNLALACAMARVKYARSPEPLPGAEDAEGMSQLYKTVYNSSEGAATIPQVLPAFQTAVT